MQSERGKNSRRLNTWAGVTANRTPILAPAGLQQGVHDTGLSGNVEMVLLCQPSHSWADSWTSESLWDLSASPSPMTRSIVYIADAYSSPNVLHVRASSCFSWVQRNCWRTNQGISQFSTSAPVFLCLQFWKQCIHLNPLQVGYEGSEALLSFTVWCPFFRCWSCSRKLKILCLCSSLCELTKRHLNFIGSAFSELLEQQHFYWIRKKKIFLNVKWEIKVLLYISSRAARIFLFVFGEREHVLKIVRENCAREARGADRRSWLLLKSP